VQQLEVATIHPDVCEEETFLLLQPVSLFPSNLVSDEELSLQVSMNHNMFDFDQSLSVIQGHLVGMFAPALFTSTIISSFGLLQTICAGEIASQT
jgi:hypothetical protein